MRRVERKTIPRGIELGLTRLDGFHGEGELVSLAGLGEKWLDSPSSPQEEEEGVGEKLQGSSAQHLAEQLGRGWSGAAAARARARLGNGDGRKREMRGRTRESR